MSKKKRYEILRYGYYPEDWTDNQTNKRLTSLEIEKICNRQSKQISDLQSQLQQANEIINNPDTLIFQQQQLIDNLKSQLAEKDEKIKNLRIDLKDYQDLEEKISTKYDKVVEQLEEKEEQLNSTQVGEQFALKCGIEAKELLAEKEKEQNQKAIEQLEKIKEICKAKFEWWENSEWEGNIYDKSDVSNAYFDIEANIDQQINELKKVEDVKE